MTADARKRADRCFALARSTTFEGERANAIAQGTRIAEAAGLSLDLFDIPGRAKTTKPAPSRYADDLFAKPRAPREYNADEVDDAMARFQENMRRQMNDAAYQAFYSTQAAEEKRAQDEAAERLKRSIKAAAERAAEHRSRAKAEREAKLARIADAVNNALWALGWRVYRDADGEDGRRRWHVTNPDAATFENVDDARLCRLGGEAGVTVDSLMAAQYRSATGKNWS